MLFKKKKKIIDNGFHHVKIQVVIIPKTKFQKLIPKLNFLESETGCVFTVFKTVSKYNRVPKEGQGQKTDRSVLHSRGGLPASEDNDK